MSGFQNSKNVWGKCNRASRGSFKHKNGDQGRSEKMLEKNNSSLSLGPFGSRSQFGNNTGAVSLPINGPMKGDESLFSFEHGFSSSRSSNSSNQSSGQDSPIGFGIEPKRFKWIVDDRDTPGQLMEKTLNTNGSKNSINIGDMVENVFKDEIGKMTESYQKGSFVWM